MTSATATESAKGKRGIVLGECIADQQHTTQRLLDRVMFLKVSTTQTKTHGTDGYGRREDAETKR